MLRVGWASGWDFFEYAVEERSAGSQNEADLTLIHRRAELQVLHMGPPVLPDGPVGCREVDQLPVHAAALHYDLKLPVSTRDGEGALRVGIQRCGIRRWEPGWPWRRVVAAAAG